MFLFFLAVLPLDTKGRQNKDGVPLIYAHTDFVTDLQFSPFDDGLLATGSQDLTVSSSGFLDELFLILVPDSGCHSTLLYKYRMGLNATPGFYFSFYGFLGGVQFKF